MVSPWSRYESLVRIAGADMSVQRAKGVLEFNLHSIFCARIRIFLACSLFVRGFAPVIMHRTFLYLS